jgi:hypothetical protein
MTITIINNVMRCCVGAPFPDPQQHQQHQKLTLVAANHLPVNPDGKIQPTLIGERALWKRVLHWLLTKDEVGLEEDFPVGQLHVSTRGRDRRTRAVISGNDAWVQR